MITRPDRARAHTTLLSHFSAPYDFKLTDRVCLILINKYTLGNKWFSFYNVLRVAVQPLPVRVHVAPPVEAFLPQPVLAAELGRIAYPTNGAIIL